MTKRISLLVAVLITFYSFGKNKPPLKPFIVVLDAGHGGHDPGNRGNGLFEKTIALDIILKTGAILEKNPNIKVVYTRKEDKFIDLFVRGQIANKAKADLFVSVHCNAHNTQAYGTETFVLGLHANNRNFNIAKKENSVILLEDNYKQNYDGFDPNSPESVIGLTITQEEYLEQSLSLASFIQNNFSKQLNRKNRGVKQAGFIVLHQTVMPSVLIETGFLSNKNEGKYLNSPKGKNQMAKSIAKAILDYKNSVQNSFAVNKPIPVVSKNKPPKNLEKINTTPKAAIKVPSKKETAVKVAVVKKEKTIEKKEKKPNITPAKASKEITKKSVKKATPSILFRVQLAASRTLIKTDAKNFKGIPNIEMFEIDQYYKYYFGKTADYSNAKELRREALSTGFKGCFIVAFEKGKPIKLYEALQKQKALKVK